MNEPGRASAVWREALAIVVRHPVATVAPVIVTEFLGPLAALRRSNELVRGNFELVFLTSAFAVVLEEAIADTGTLVGPALTGSETRGQWLGGSVGTILILPVASFATALVYGRLRRLEERSALQPQKT